ncbi:MAG: MarR family transcriptional regulator [Mycobacterium sp.]|nr:MAG: MarR family transcriptional regulator [Mycobacterium sp.]
MQRPYRRRTASDLPGLDIAEQRSWQNYLHAALRFHTAMDRWLTEAHQLSAIDLRVLDILENSADGAVRMGDLADALAANPHHVTKRIRRLEDRGMVRRAQNPKDRRGVVARITDEGRSVVASACVDYAQGVKTHLTGSLSRRQLATLAENCHRINAGLDQSDST